jgi:hypothetical protein
MGKPIWVVARLPRRRALSFIKAPRKEVKGAMLTKEQKLKIKEEEEFRAQVIKEQAKKDKPSKGKGCLILIAILIGLGIIMGITQGVHKAYLPKPTPTPTPNPKFMSDLSDLFCISRQGINAYGRFVCAGCANLDDIHSFLNSSELITINKAERAPTKESCDNVANDCVKTWDEKTCIDIASQKYWLGMTKDQLIVSLGLPNEQNDTVGSWGFHTQWVYGTYGPYIYLEGTDKTHLKVTSYQD